jgi:glycogen debranching enzyme
MSEETLDQDRAKRTGKRRTARSAARERSPYYILATSPQADEHNQVLKHGDTFGVFDHYGDITPAGLGEEGIYHEGTRFLSSLLLGLGESRPMFLSSTVKEDNDLLAVDLTNPDMFDHGRLVVPRGTLHLARIKFLWQGICYEQLSVQNYSLGPVEISLVFHFGADFADIFEVRGTQRRQRGQDQEPTISDSSVVLVYLGLDGVRRQTRLLFSPRPTALTSRRGRFDLSLPPQGEAAIYLTTVCEGPKDPPSPLPYDQALAAATGAMKSAQNACSRICASNEEFNAWVNRTVADLHMMVTQTDKGPYPYAGVPWFSTPFGRDGILTALECLWLYPALARGVLAYLASTQATEVTPEQDAEPGKILHETRGGEMAALGEIPFGRYYGSVDATPLFVLLAGAYYERTGDRPFIEAIWPNLEAALRWCDTYGDRDGDGFVEYYRQSPKGLVQQGWKDSHDSIFHTDGTLAQGPIALCEVQGYLYAARCGAAQLASVLGQPERAAQLQQQARTLQQCFEQAFWCDDLSTYALALDGDKRPCRVRASNAGHCLFTGIASREHARLTARTLLAPESFSGWGIRTLAATEARYNPMSYHNGSIWPHDNALIADGLARYGLMDGVRQVMAGLFDASRFMDLHRLPELFCGFVRREGEGPTLYPVACAPQAWSAACVYLLLRSCLGLSIRVPQAQICFNYPVLPAFLKDVHLYNVQVGEASVDLLLQRHGDDVGINVLRRSGNVTIQLLK